MQVFALRVGVMKRLLLAAFAAAASLGCQRESTMVPANALVDAADPPDDGGSSRGSAGGLQHAQALEALVRFPIGTVQSADGRVRMSLPAGAHWRRVTFWGFDAYTGFRFGQDHHGVAGVTLIEPLKGEGDRACIAAFDEWAKPFIEAFSLKLSGAAETSLTLAGRPAFARRVYATGDSPIGVVDYYSAYAVTRTSDDVCVVLGLAVPVREAGERAKRALDRMADEAFRSAHFDAALVRPKP